MTTLIIWCKVWWSFSVPIHWYEKVNQNYELTCYIAFTKQRKFDYLPVEFVYATGKDFPTACHNFGKRRRARVCCHYGIHSFLSLLTYTLIFKGANSKPHFAHLSRVLRRQDKVKEHQERVFAWYKVPAKYAQLDNIDLREMFRVLYKSWAHSPASLLSLCLLCQAYEHACEILTCFAELEMTVNFLLEIDKLVQLLESPIFTCMIPHFAVPSLTFAYRSSPAAARAWKLSVFVQEFVRTFNDSPTKYGFRNSPQPPHLCILYLMSESTIYLIKQIYLPWACCIWFQSPPRLTEKTLRAGKAFTSMNSWSTSS